jgi:hypothetical protein
MPRVTQSRSKKPISVNTVSEVDECSNNELDDEDEANQHDELQDDNEQDPKTPQPSSDGLSDLTL